MPPTRRELLISAALLCGATAGCSADRQRPAARTGPDPQILDLASERGLVAMYDATMSAHPSFTPRLKTMRAEHAAHADALQQALGTNPKTAAAPTVSADPTAALARVLHDERSTVLARARSCALADPSRAALLGSIAASEAEHVEMLSASSATAAPSRPVPAATHTDIAALQVALAAEYAASWGYDVVGGQVSSSLQSVVRVVQANHADWQRLTAQTILDAHGTPAPTKAGYALPFRVHDTATAVALAAYLEESVARSWRYVLGQTSGRAVRQLAVAALMADGVQAVRWRRQAGNARSTAFPGA